MDFFLTVPYASFSGDDTYLVFPVLRHDLNPNVCRQAEEDEDEEEEEEEEEADEAEETKVAKP